jgi:type II secretion system (T2SS) protein M
VRRWLEDRNRRAAILLAFALVVYLSFAEVVFPVYDNVKSLNGRVTERAEQLRKFRQAVSRKGNYGTLITDANKRVGELQSRLLSGTNPVAAAAEVQAMVEDSARKLEISLAQRSIVAAKKKDTLTTEVGVSVTFESTPFQLAGFLAEIRNAPKFLKVSAAQISPVQIARQVPANGELGKNLRVSLTVVGLVGQ